MAINIRTPQQIRGGVRFTRESDTDAHYNDLLANEVLTKAEFPSGVHEVISDPTSNNNPTREFYQLSILTNADSDGGVLTITTDNFISIPAPGTNNPPNTIAQVTVESDATADEIALSVTLSMELLHGEVSDTPRFLNINNTGNIINFSTINRGLMNDHVIPDVGNGYIRTGANTDVTWRLDILSQGSDAAANTEIILDAGIWTGV